ncbi:MAG: hypothetical protein WC071_07195, partial [Victivallaceae bacterium]
IDENSVEYVVDSTIATRPNGHHELSSRQSEAKLGDLKNFIEFGASPRAAICLVLAAKAAAFMSGRAYVVPQDVKDVAADILRHRIILTYEAEAENLDTDAIIKIALDELRTP